MARIQGNAASIVAAVSFTPGRISIANARVGGKAALSALNAALAVASVLGRMATAARRLASSAASAAIVVLKLDTRSLSWVSLRTRPADVRAAPETSRCRSRSGSVPSSASLTWDCARSAGPMSS